MKTQKLYTFHHKKYTYRNNSAMKSFLGFKVFFLFISSIGIIIDLKLFLTLFIIVCFLRTLNEKTPVLFEVN